MHNVFTYNFSFFVLRGFLSGDRRTKNSAIARLRTSTVLLELWFDEIVSDEGFFGAQKITPFLEQIGECIFADGIFLYIWLCPDASASQAYRGATWVCVIAVVPHGVTHVANGTRNANLNPHGAKVPRFTWHLRQNTEHDEILEWRNKHPQYEIIRDIWYWEAHSLDALGWKGNESSLLSSPKQVRSVPYALCNLRILCIVQSAFTFCIFTFYMGGGTESSAIITIRQE